MVRSRSRSSEQKKELFSGKLKVRQQKSLEQYQGFSKKQESYMKYRKTQLFHFENSNMPQISKVEMRNDEDFVIKGSQVIPRFGFSRDINKVSEQIKQGVRRVTVQEMQQAESYMERDAHYEFPAS
jgi:hypothetical protein